MTREEYREAMLPHWKAFQAEVAAAWKLYPAQGFYAFRQKARAASDKYQAAAAELWQGVCLSRD